MKARDWRIIVLVVGVVVIGCGEVRACNTAPVAVIKPNLEYRGGMYHTMVGAKVVFDLRDSFDPDPYDYIVKYKLEFWVEGVTKDLELTQCLEDCPGGKRDHYFDGIVTRVFNGSCSYYMVLTVTDNHGASDDYCFWLLVHRSVAKDGTGNFGTITAALTDWLYNSENWASSEVWVAPGRYKESVVFESGHDELILRSSDLTDAEVVAKTVIAAESMSSNVVVFGTGITEATKLQGFTVEGPWGWGTPSSPGRGIYCNVGSPVIENCVIRGHFTGVYNDALAHPVISNCVVYGNGIGAGMVNDGASAAGKPVKLRNCVIAGNQNEDLIIDGVTQYYGGGIHNENSRLEMWNCTIFGNYAWFSGGIDNYGTATVTMENCIVWGNMTNPKLSPNYDEIANWEGAGAVTAEYSDIRDRLNSSSVYGMVPENFVECIGENLALHDPRFAAEGEPAGADGIFGTLDDGLRIRPGSGSPCIDAGNPDTTTGEVGEADLWGNARFRDGDYGAGDVVIDMGACEVASVWFVDYDEVGNDDGKSWASAFEFLKNAFDAARTGDEIWVAKGTYKPTTGSDRTIAFVLPSGVEVYGGFPAGSNEPSWADRDWLENTTTLSGDINDIGDDDSYHVVKGADDAVIDGFVISGGRADGSGVDSRGGGMYNEDCEPVVRNCKFTGNYASIGGGMANYGGARPVVEGCIFEDNEGADGGGMYNYKSAPDVSRCVFSGNEGNGAGMCNWGIGASPLVVNCVFADDGGGWAVYNVTSNEDFNNVPVFTNCTFSRNGYGLAMYNLFSAPTVTNCILWATGEGYPAVFNYIRADASFRHCDIEGSGGSGDWNGAMGRDGGGNIEADPVFEYAGDADGLDDKWMTGDDGLRPDTGSPCIDAADGDAAPEKDIRGVPRYDEPGVGGGVGQPDYVDIGAYEHYPVIVVMCWIDESYWDGGYIRYYSDADRYDADLDAYDDLVRPITSVVRSGCLVPPKPELQGTVPGIEAVLPEGYDPPEEISVETCGRPPTSDELLADFERIREGLVPDVIILSVDNSGSMYTEDIDPQQQDYPYTTFKNTLKAAYPDAVFVERDDCDSPTGCFDDQAWVDEMRSQIQAVVEQ